MKVKLIKERVERFLEGKIDWGHALRHDPRYSERADVDPDELSYDDVLGTADVPYGGDMTYLAGTKKFQEFLKELGIEPTFEQIKAAMLKLGLDDQKAGGYAMMGARRFDR